MRKKLFGLTVAAMALGSAPAFAVEPSATFGLQAVNTRIASHVPETCSQPYWPMVAAAGETPILSPIPPV